MSKQWSAFVTFSAALLARLFFHPSRHVRAGDNVNNSSFLVGEGVDEGEFFPLVLKFPAATPGRPDSTDLAQEGQIFRMRAVFEPAFSYRTATGEDCRSRDRIVLYNQPAKRGADAFARGELRIVDCSADEHVDIWPAPAFRRDVVGSKDTRLCLWLADNGVEYKVRIESNRDRVLFAGPVVVQMAGLEEEARPGSIKIDVGEGDARFTVYDRREDRMCSFARGELIERSFVWRGEVRRSFRFLNLRDLPVKHDLELDPPTRVVTAAGIEDIEGVDEEVA